MVHFTIRQCMTELFLTKVSDNVATPTHNTKYGICTIIYHVHVKVSSLEIICEQGPPSSHMRTKLAICIYSVPNISQFVIC